MIGSLSASLFFVRKKKKKKSGGGATKVFFSWRIDC